MKITKGIITRKEALSISKDYVAFAEGDFDKYDVVLKSFEKLKRGQKVLTYVDGQFVTAKVSSVKNSWLNEDGPVVRVSNGEFSWRVDGCDYAFPIS
jgi:hypothetical protein